MARCSGSGKRSRRHELLSTAWTPGEAPGKDLEGACPGREGAANDWKALTDLMQLGFSHAHHQRPGSELLATAILGVFTMVFRRGNFPNTNRTLILGRNINRVFKARPHRRSENTQSIYDMLRNIFMIIHFVSISL